MNHHESKRKMWAQREGKALFTEEHHLTGIEGMIENPYFTATVIKTEGMMQMVLESLKMSVS